VAAARPESVSLSAEEPSWLADAAIAAGRQALDSILERCGLSDTRLRVEVDSAPEGLSAATTAEHASLLAVGANGQGALGSARMGSVPRTVFSTAACPVLVVPASAPPHPRNCARAGRRPTVLCGIDGSSASFKAALLAGDMARRMDGSLILMHSCCAECRHRDESDPGPLSSIRAHDPGGALQLLHAVADLLSDVAVDVHLTMGKAATSLLGSAVLDDADLIVVGCRDDMSRADSYRVPARLAMSAPAPTVVVPHTVEVELGSGGDEPRRLV
jgi:nucleotide-binding universal stress UspA family protein